LIKSSVTISLVPSLSGGPWIYWDELDVSIPKAKSMGFDAVELFTASADAVNPQTLTLLLEEHNLALSAVGTGAGKVLHNLSLTNPEESIRQKAINYISDMIDFGGPLGAPAIIGSMQGKVEKGGNREQAMFWLAEGLETLGQKAENHGVKLIYELLNRYEANLINRLEEGVELIRSLNCDNVTLLADLFHMNIEEVSLPDALKKAGRYIGYIHFADSNRRPAGMGHIDMAVIARVLKEINYSGYISAEALPYPDPDGAAQQTIDAFLEFMIPAFKHK